MNTDAPHTQTIKCPPQLLQASGNTDSLQDNKKSSISWEPRQSVSLPSQAGVNYNVPRRPPADYSTTEGLRNLQQIESTLQRNGNDDVSPSADTNEQSQSDRRHSYFPRRPDATYQVHRKTSSQPIYRSHGWVTNDPFSTRRKSSSKAIFIPGLTKPPIVTQISNTAHTRIKSVYTVSKDDEDQVHARRGTGTSYSRRSSLWQIYEQAKKRGKELQRQKYVQYGFEYSMYAIIVLFVYLVLVGIPLWNGSVYWLWWVVANKFVIAGGFGITLGLAIFYAFAPLLVLFEKDPPAALYTDQSKVQRNVLDTALLIPCYKSAGLIAATLEAALKVFPPSHIFVIANGNSPVPLDNTEEICRPYGVNHVWSPVGSKIIAQFVGCYAAKTFKNVLLIDDDCALPENFPVVTERLVGKIQCVGYTIKSVGPNSSKGNLCQQAQDLEYKLSGLQRSFAGLVGSATFPHGAISLWDRKMLVKTFHEHPGFSVSEDWFFGHVARKLGCRITMCTQVFVETETPKAVFLSSGGARGGFGEMTVFQQRFKRWNFFFVNGLWYNLVYVVCDWKLGWWEIGAKIFVLQEVYETLLYLFTPFILPISFYVRPSFCGILLASTILMYAVNVVVFNEIHLRRKSERLGWTLLYIYYLPYKIVLTVVNVASCYWSMWKYAHYFAKRHPKVIEDENAVAIVMRLEEEVYNGGRRMTVTATPMPHITTYSDNETSDSALSESDLHPASKQSDAAHVRIHYTTNDQGGNIDFDDRRTLHFSQQRAIGKIEFGVRV